MLAYATPRNMDQDTRDAVCAWLYANGIHAGGLRNLRVLTPTEIELDVYECDHLGNRLPVDGRDMVMGPATRTVAMTLHEPIPADVLAILPRNPL